MSEIFQLQNLERLITDKKPPAILLIDTNVLMDCPDMRQWKTSLKEPVFVLSYVNRQELMFLKNPNPQRDSRKIKDNQEKSQKAIKALNNMRHLFKQGNISEGIPQGGIGWFISISYEANETLDYALERYKIIREAYKEYDTHLFLLLRECTNTIKNVPTILISRDNDLFLLASEYGIPVHNPKTLTFPMNLDKLVKKKPLVSINFDEILDEITHKIESITNEVQLTLTARKLVPDWLNILPKNGAEHRPVLIAEGNGIINYPQGSQTKFRWQLPFLPHTSHWINFGTSVRGFNEVQKSLIKNLEHPKGKYDPVLILIQGANIDFFENDKTIPDEIKNAIMEEMRLYFIPGGTNTVQSFLCILLDFFESIHFRDDQDIVVFWNRDQVDCYIDYTNVDISDDGEEIIRDVTLYESKMEELQQMHKERFYEWQSICNSYLSFRRYASSFLQEHPEYIQSLFFDLDGYWNIGETKTFRISN